MNEKPYILMIYGICPETIKVAPVILALRDSKLRAATLTTGQHSEMVASANQIFSITPDESLSVMHPGQSLNALATRILVGLDEELEQIRPNTMPV